MTTTWTYTPLGDVETVTDPDGLVTTSTWDLRRRLDTRTNPAEETTEYEYDLAGNRIERKRPSEAVWLYEYDDADRLITVTNPETEQTTYTWDANGNLASQTDALERTTSFGYDKLDYRTQRTYHGGPTETFVHDARGNLVSHTDANGQVRTFEYDGLDRRVEANYPAATGDEAIQVEYEYDGNGNRRRVVETIAAGGTEISTYQYDAFDRLEVETDRFGQQITHVYDDKGNRIRRIDATGTTIYGIDALDRVQSVTAPGRGAMVYTYSPAGRVEQIDHPDGTRTEQTYDEAGRLETIAHFRSGIREAFYAYDYDLNGNRSSQTEDLGAGEVLTTYDYDRADRLVETERAGRVTTYVLDAVGNRKEEIVTEGGLTTEKTFDYNARDQLERIWLDGSLEAEYAYDANGNRIEARTGGVTREFNFGARDRLLSLNVQGSPPEVEWTYDDAGFRIAETTPAEARRFRWDGETMAFETNVLGNLLMRYDHGPDRLLAETEAGNTRTWLTDALKTPVKRLTETGTTYSVTRYDEYGEVEEETSPDIPRFGFTGHQRGPQEAPDLYYAQQRWYNSATGRFISEDPVWGEPRRPLSLHRYLYAYANPTVFVDPDGRMGLPNSWDELPGYEPPELCELCYIDGTPEQKAAAYAALPPVDRDLMAGATVGMAKRLGQIPANAVMGAATLTNAGVDLLTGGRLYGGSADRVVAGARSTATFFADPIGNTRAHFDQIDAEFNLLYDQGRGYEAGVVGAQGAADLVEGGVALASLSGLGVSTTRQLGREMAGSPTTYYVQESSISFITELWRGDVPPPKKVQSSVTLRLMKGPGGSTRIRGEGGRIESIQQSVRRQIIGEQPSAPYNGTLVPDSRQLYEDIQRRRKEIDNREARASVFEASGESIDWLRALGQALWRTDSRSEVDGIE